MSHQEALAILRTGKTGADILSLLDKVSSMYSDTSESDSDFSDIEFND
jgi:hypothetical protein